MTRLFNAPEAFVDEALEGFALAHGDRVRRVEGGIVRRGAAEPNTVAVVVGGGSGHYPAFAGLVGHGLAAGAVCGNLFASPSSAQAYRIARAAESGAGVLFTFGNYAGDVMHFGMASERLIAHGIDTRTVLVTDDVASSPTEAQRRGIAGDLVVFKVAGSAAAEGRDLDEVERLARAANGRTRTLGAAFAGPTFPGAEHPLFEIPPGMFSLGLGIHGEPGISDHPMVTADELAEVLVERLLADRPDPTATSVAVLVNGLGAITDEELFVVFRAVHRLLTANGLEIVAPRVGQLVTSLDMAGVSLTLVWLDDELAHHWTAASDAPGFSSGRPVRRAADAARPSAVDDAVTAAEAPDACRASDAPGAPVAQGRPRPGAARVPELLGVALAEVEAREAMLGDLDSVAGDGDHGVGMRRGLTAAVDAARAACARGGSVDDVLARAGDAWSDRAGGTSGALWGAALHALARTARADEARSPAAFVAAASRAALDGIQRLGGAAPGDKTMVDALTPFVEAMEREAAAGVPLHEAFTTAAREATAAAERTAELTPRKGRARPLAARSLGSPDPGAVSFALIVSALALAISRES